MGKRKSGGGENAKGAKAAKPEPVSDPCVEKIIAWFLVWTRYEL